MDHKRTAAVYGAGIAGLTTAHELARRGWSVNIYEANADAGGFFRSARVPGDRNMPSEYSWHGMGPWYHNVFDLMKQIPFDASGSVYDRALSRPIDFGTAPNDGEAQFDDTGPMPDVRRMFRMTRRDRLQWAWLMLKTWTSNRRSLESYARLNAAAAFGKVLTPVAASTWTACFGPWVGSDWTNVSLHQVGLFFRRQLLTKPRHYHRADAEGPAWSQGARSGWLLLRGPSSEYWFDHWVAYLQSLGVQFQFQQPLDRFELCGQLIFAGRLSSGRKVHADVHVLAINPFTTCEVLERTPELEQVDELKNFRPLTQNGPHNQVSFRIAFAECIRWPRARCGLVIVDSEFNLTLFAEEQVWSRSVEKGSNVASLWTATACVSRVPGCVHQLPVDRCTEAQFIDEVKEQLLRCGALDALIREANDGRPLVSFAIERIEVWHEWIFSPNGIRSPQPKWVNTTHTQSWLPAQRTPVRNLVLAGAHTRTDADVWSIEAAVESGRRAAKIAEPEVQVLPQYIPAWPRFLRSVDDVLYAAGAPPVLTVLSIGIALSMAVALVIGITT